MKKALLFSSMLLLGSGCIVTNFNTALTPAEDVDLALGSTLTIEQTWMGVNIPKDDENNVREVTMQEWSPNVGAKFSWTMENWVETADSVVARNEATANAGIGEDVAIPEPVFEQVTANGVVTVEDLAAAERVTLPAYWPEGDWNAHSKKSSVIWLSQAQYNELVETRTTHIELGLFDSTVADVLTVADKAKDVLALVQGRLDAADTETTDFTKLEAAEDWGSMKFMYNGQPVVARTIKASSAFAEYTVLANPENPLILKITVKPWALGAGMLRNLNVLQSFLGYQITSIRTSAPSEGQPVPLAPDNTDDQIPSPAPSVPTDQSL